MSPRNGKDDQERDPKEAGRLRDKVLKRMLETPPKPRESESSNSKKSKK